MDISIIETSGLGDRSYLVDHGDGLGSCRAFAGTYLPATPILGGYGGGVTARSMRSLPPT
jgi:hypothetical protein